MAQDIRDSKAYLGRGMAFPLQMNPRGEFALVDGEDDIYQSIFIILSTRPGERVMRPEFGCRVHELIFEPRDASTAALAQKYVSEALLRWEPRIDVNGVTVYGDANHDGAMIVDIQYTIKATHDERSIVYPFFLVGEEAW